MNICAYRAHQSHADDKGNAGAQAECDYRRHEASGALLRRQAWRPFLNLRSLSSMSEEMAWLIGQNSMG